MLRAFAVTFALAVFLLTACSPPDELKTSYQLSPASLIDASFSPNGTLAVTTSEQVAVYNMDGQLQALLDLPPADGLWHIAWLNSRQLAITDAKHIYQWDYRQARLTGPWESTQPIRHISARHHQLAMALEGGLVEWLYFAAVATATEEGQPEGRQRLAFDERISALHFDTSHGLFIGDEGGQLHYWLRADEQPQWSIDTGSPQHLVQAISSSDDQLVVITQPAGDHFAQGRGQQIVQIDKVRGKIKHRFDAVLDGQARSLLVDGPHVWLGSSGNCIYLRPTQDTTSNYCYPRPQRFGRQTGQVIALHITDTKVYAVTSAGYLQVWLKQDIVSAI